MTNPVIALCELALRHRFIRIASAPTNKQLQIVSFALAVVGSIFISLSFCGLQAFSQDADSTGLNKQEENFLKETQLLKKEQEMEALTKKEGEVDDQQIGKTAKNRAETLPDKMMRPKNATKGAAAESQSGQSQAGNTAGDIARDMACMAIDYASRFMKNFTTEDGNRWNKYRNQVFVPIALLLILPGAVLTQVRAIMAQGNPVVGGASPLEGIQRGMIAVFLVPGSCLVTNYSVDLGNSLHYTVSSEYSRIIGGDMYKDAMCAEIRAFGVRYLSENEGSLKDVPPDLSPRGSEPFAKIEGRLWGKISDPCAGLLLVPPNRDDTIMPQASLATRLGMYTANAGICAGWGMLTAFQMAFFYYLYFVGPIMAALWAWPTQMFKQAFPTWVESCVTLAFWSFLWQITICLLAMTKSQASTGLYMVTALNVLATTSVKHAFDCASIMKSAVQACEMIGAEVAAAAEGGGGGGGGKGGGKSGQKGGSKKGGSKVGATPDKLAATPTPGTPGTPVKVAAHSAEPADDAREPNKVPAVLEPSKKLAAMDGVVVQTTLPPAAQNALNPNAAVAQNTVWDDTGLAAFAATACVEPADYTTTLNSTTGVWNDPVMVSGPPQAGPASPVSPRNTIGSVLGNAIEAVMHYPANVPIQDPDLVYVKNSEEKSEAENQNQSESTNQEETQPNSVSENFSPDSNSPDKVQEMNSNDDPRITVLREQRFNFPPPPMVSGQPAAGFAKVPTGVALTPQQLLSKLQAVAEPTTSFAPPPPPGLSNCQPQAPIRGFSRLYEADPDCSGQEETIVTVADFTSDLQGQSEPAPRQPSLNNALSNVLRHRGAWAQAESQVKPPVNETVSTSWWSS